MKKPLSQQKKTISQTTLFSDGLTDKERELQILMFENSSAMKKDKQKKYYKNKRK